MHGVGFEPTRLSPCDLKSHPLDQLGHPCFLHPTFIFYLKKIDICCKLGFDSSHLDSNQGYRNQNPMSLPLDYRN